MPEFKRSQRVAEQIQRDLSDLLLKKINDPRVGFATFTRVKVSDDLRNAMAFVSVWGDEKKKKETMEGLKSAVPFFEREIFKRMEIKVPTKLSLRLDESREKGDKVAMMLRELEVEREQREGA